MMAAVGADGAGYLTVWCSWARAPSSSCVEPESYTAQAMIITDTDNNQITAFHPWGDAGRAPDGDRGGEDLRIGDHRARRPRRDVAASRRSRRGAHPFIFDPPGLPMFDGGSCGGSSPRRAGSRSTTTRRA